MSYKVGEHTYDSYSDYQEALQEKSDNQLVEDGFAKGYQYAITNINRFRAGHILTNDEKQILRLLVDHIESNKSCDTDRFQMLIVKKTW